MSKIYLVSGDLLAILIITLIGFAMHGERDLSFLPRFEAIYFPLSFSWFVLAPGLGLFQDENLHDARQLWRPALGAIFAAPFAVVLRGLILNAAITSTFAVVLTAAFAMGITLWRGFFFLLSHKTA